MLEVLRLDSAGARMPMYLEQKPDARPNTRGLTMGGRQAFAPGTWACGLLHCQVSIPLTSLRRLYQNDNRWASSFSVLIGSFISSTDAKFMKCSTLLICAQPALVRTLSQPSRIYIFLFC